MNDNFNNQEISFPAEFHLKVIGDACDEFEQTILMIVKKHVPDLKENALRQRSSNKGNYLALSFDFTATSQKQLDSLYDELRTAPYVKFLL